MSMEMFNAVAELNRALFFLEELAATNKDRELKQQLLDSLKKVKRDITFFTSVIENTQVCLLRKKQKVYARNGEYLGAIQKIGKKYLTIVNDTEYGRNTEIVSKERIPVFIRVYQLNSKGEWH